MVRGNNCHHSLIDDKLRMAKQKRWSVSYFLNKWFIFYAVASSPFFGMKNLCFACVLLIYIKNHQPIIIRRKTRLLCDDWRVCSLTPRTLFWMFWLVLGERDYWRTRSTEVHARGGGGESVWRLLWTMIGCSLTPRTQFWMFWLVIGERSLLTYEQRGALIHVNNVS